MRHHILSIALILCVFLHSTSAVADSRQVFPGIMLVSHRAFTPKPHRFLYLQSERLSKNTAFYTDARQNQQVITPHTRSQSLCRRAKMRRIQKSARGYVRCLTNDMFQTTEAPNDTYYSLQYAHQTMATSSAWDITTGSQDFLALVIDTGVDINHPDLRDNIWTNPREINNNGIDDDKNGYVDDYNGMNAITTKGSGIDDNGHGTHVAGIIGAVTNNKLGVAGVAPKVKLVGVKFLSSDGVGSTVNAIRAINYGVALKKAGNNVVVMNNSYGSSAFSKPFLDAIKEAEAANILFVASAGNNAKNNDIYPNYPANYQANNVVSVASSTTQSLSYFSNYGSSVHIAAPGHQILSTITGSKYAYKSGTSMASPQVSGLAILTKAACDLDASTIKQVILNNGVKQPELKDKVSSESLANAAGAVYAAKSMCLTPTPSPIPTQTPVTTPSATPTPPQNVVATAMFSPSIVQPNQRTDLILTGLSSTQTKSKIQFTLKTAGNRTYACNTFGNAALKSGGATLRLLMPDTIKYFAEVQATINSVISTNAKISTQFRGTPSTTQINDVCLQLTKQIK